MDILKKRSDFLKTAKGLKYVSRGFVLQALERNSAADTIIDKSIRIGFTASKKVGNAVCRNRAKRRLRELARNIASPVAKTGYDYVFIARKNILAMEFNQLVSDVQQAMHKIHRAKKPNNR
ncbi:MAG: ribonuclease P protein component [Rhizobiales bacterium]|nr:ribonuclease P protein component [Hyphomicrobiales bacterium]NRB14288.1 ribonuclease P protein component [Hyphomicrobiales bacterium]